MCLSLGFIAVKRDYDYSSSYKAKHLNVAGYGSELYLHGGKHGVMHEDMVLERWLSVLHLNDRQQGAGG